MIEEDTTSIDKNESTKSKLDFHLSEQAESKIEELNVMFEKQQSLHGKRKALIRKLLETLREDGFKDHQIVDIVLGRVKGVSRSTIYAALPQEVKRKWEHTKPLPKTINITTEHKMIDVEPEKEKIIIPTKNSEQFYEELEEDPTETENQFLKEKVTELEDALKQTEQFKPATAFEVEKDSKLEPHIKDMSFEFLREVADGVHSFYYDTYGIDLFKNRELSQLKNSGVKVFKRLYFEV